MHAVSPYGTYDQGGNVFEWNEDGRARGGAIAISLDLYRDLASSSPSFYGVVEDPMIGFRVASSAFVPEPHAAWLAAMGGTMLA